MTEPDLLLTATEAAALLGVNRTHVHNLIERGELVAYQLPTKGEVRTGRLYIPREAVLALKERRRQKGAPEPALP